MIDEGLAPHRTVLAWQRTALAAGTAGCVVARLSLPVTGAAVGATMLVTVALTAWLLAAATRTRTPDGRAPAVLSTGMVVLCVMWLFHMLSGT